MTENKKANIIKTEKEIIKRIAGEIDRLKVYAEKGDITPQNIPHTVLLATKKIKDITS